MFKECLKGITPWGKDLNAALVIILTLRRTTAFFHIAPCDPLCRLGSTTFFGHDRF